MRGLLIILLFPLLCQAQWNNQEKLDGSQLYHFGFSMLATMGTTTILDYYWKEGRYNKFVGFGVGMGIGLVKEFTEDVPDRSDLIADFAGCVVGVTLTICWDKQKKYKLKWQNKL